MTERGRPLRIAQMLDTHGPGGAEIVLLNLGRELRDRGHAVIPVGPSGSWLNAQFSEDGFDPRCFDLRRPLDWRALRDLARQLREQGVDVVHSHEFTMSVYGAAAARLIRRPHVITMHGNQKMTRALRRRLALRWAFRNSRATVAVSGATKIQLDEDIGLAPEVISIVRNGVPVPMGDAEPIRRELGLREEELLILAVGNLDPRKGHIILLQALDELGQRSAPAWRLAIAGGRGGPEERRLEEFAADHGMAERVHILKYRNDIPDLLAAADIFTMPSLWEGLPLAILEAMLAGTTVVASTTSGIPEAIVSGEHGLLTPPGEVAPLADALQTLMTDAAYRRRLAAQARDRALTEFTVGAMADAYEGLYEAATT